MIHPKICSLLLLFFYFPIIFSPAALGNVRQQPSPCTLMYWMSRWSSLCVQGPLFSPAVCSRLQQQEEEAEACFGAMLNPCTLHCPVRPSVFLPACLPACLSFTVVKLLCVNFPFPSPECVCFLRFQITYSWCFSPPAPLVLLLLFLKSSSSATDSKLLLLLLLLLQQQIQNYFFFFFFFFFFFSNKFKTISSSSSSSTTDSKLFLLLLLLLLLEFFFFFSNRFKIISSSCWILLLQQQQIQIKSSIIHWPSILFQACSKFPNNFNYTKKNLNSPNTHFALNLFIVSWWWAKCWWWWWWVMVMMMKKLLANDPQEF